MNLEIIQHKKFKDNHGSILNNYKVFYKSRGIWISDKDFKQYPALLSVDKGTIKIPKLQDGKLTLNEKNTDVIILKEPIDELYHLIKKKNRKGEFLVLQPKITNTEAKEPEVNYETKKTNVIEIINLEELESIGALKDDENIEINLQNNKTTKGVIQNQTAQNIKDNKSEKILFINNLLDYSVKKKVDSNTRERLFSLIGKEVEKSGLSKEDVEKIVEDKLKLKKSDKEVEENKFELDLAKHQPMNLIKFIDKFRDSKGIKYLTHKFEEPGQVFDRAEILKIAKKEFHDFTENNPISPRGFKECFRAFAFGEGKYKGNWYFNDKKYTLNWKSKEVEKWCNDNPGMHPIEKFEQNLIKPFQKTYKIEEGILKDYIIERLAKALGESYGNFDCEIIDCEKASFKTDVDSLLSGISGILNSIKQRENHSKKIKIVFQRKGRKRFLKIIHVGSKSKKSFEEEESDILQGDLLNVKRNLFCVCDWSINSENPSGKVNQLNILYDIKNCKNKELINVPIEGFTHLLTFYS